MHAISKLVSGRVTKWLVALTWIALLAVAAPFGGRLFEVTEDNFETFLPADAESTQVLERQEQFPGGNLTQAVVVYHRPTGIEQADRDRAARDLQALGDRFGAQGSQGEVIPSADGQALLVQVPISLTGARDTGEVQGDAVVDIRDQVGNGEGGLEIRVTGPAAATHDSLEVLTDIEAILVLVPVVVVAVLLLLIYRSPVLFLVPLITVVVSYQVASALVYGLVQGPGLVLNSLGAGVLGILVYGVGTDYALLVIARYREELRQQADRHVAMRVAVRATLPALLASASTVALGMLCLLAADLSSTRALGPVAALAVLATLVAATTLLPALLVICGRWILWPANPKLGSRPRTTRGLWSRLAAIIAARPRRIWIITCLVVAAGWIGLASYNTPQQTLFREQPDSVIGQDLVTAHFTGGATSPADIIAPQAQAGEVLSAAQVVPGVSAVQEVGRAGTDVALRAVLDAEPNSGEEYAIIQRLRDQLPEAVLVGGQSAIEMDVRDANNRDAMLLIPLVMLAVGVIIAVQLRSIVAPVLMIASVVLSFGASFGAALLIFEDLFQWSGQDASLPVLAFVFLVALGVDYNIFLVTRVRQEAVRMGTRAGSLRGLVVTGSVITSAGLVLAATFSVLAILPVVMIAELGFVVALGILVDTVIVRSIIVPAIMQDVGSRFWWPSRLTRPPTPARAQSVQPTLETQKGP